MTSRDSTGKLNPYSQDFLSRACAAHVLVRYGFSPTIISCTTHHHPKTIARIKQEYVSCGGRDKFQKRGHRITPAVIMSEPKTYYAYNELMVLYSHFHSGDPSASLEIEALLKAWVTYASHICVNPSDRLDVDINALWYLCLYMNAVTVICDEDDGGMMCYSKKESAYYYHSTHSRLRPGNSGYIKLRSLKELLELGRAKKHHSAA